MATRTLVLSSVLAVLAGGATAATPHAQAAAQGFGPQAPRDLASRSGSNPVTFARAPQYRQMNLCNIHLHRHAEHKGGEFTRPAGHDEGHGSGGGFRYNGRLTAAEAQPLPVGVCQGDHGSLQVGDTVELHYVHSTARVAPGPTLGACSSPASSNPQLRVEAQVLVLVNDPAANDFNTLVQAGERNGLWQALNLPSRTGRPIEYAGSTTGPAHNHTGSPVQVSWSVRPRVLKVDAASLGRWCTGNVFQETQAHGVRELVVDPQMLSPMR